MFKHLNINSGCNQEGDAMEGFIGVYSGWKRMCANVLNSSGKSVGELCSNLM